MNARPHWRSLASCAGADQAAFYDVRGPIDVRTQMLCRACPVRNECLNYALERKEAHGIWAGTTPATREAILRGRNRATCPGCKSPRLDVVGPSVAVELVQLCLACGLTWAVRKLTTETNWRAAARRSLSA